MIKKIALDISPTTDGNALRGVGYYTSRLLEALKKEIATNPTYSSFEINLITKKDKGFNYDLIHYPYFDPFKLTLPLRKTTPTVVTVHDLIPRQYPSHFPVGLKGQLKWWLQLYRLRQVDRIITVSEHSKHIINQITKYKAKNIVVTHLAADPSFKVIANHSLLDKVSKKYQLPKKFVLFVGDINWNKNIPTLVKACVNLSYPLVIVGSAACQKDVPNHPWTQDLRWLQSQKNPNLIFTGFVPDEELPLFYNLATFYCQPSIAEGFGLPLLQAIQSGCPVVHAQGSSLDEVMNGSGLTFNPYSQTELETALSQFWHSKKLRDKYVKLALTRANDFSWQQTAQKTLDLYHQLLTNEK